MYKRQLAYPPPPGIPPTPVYCLSLPATIILVTTRVTHGQLFLPRDFSIELSSGVFLPQTSNKTLLYMHTTAVIYILRSAARTVQQQRFYRVLLYHHTAVVMFRLNQGTHFGCGRHSTRPYGPVCLFFRRAQRLFRVVHADSYRKQLRFACLRFIFYAP